MTAQIFGFFLKLDVAIAEHRNVPWLLTSNPGNSSEMNMPIICSSCTKRASGDLPRSSARNLMKRSSWPGMGMSPLIVRPSLFRCIQTAG